MAGKRQKYQSHTLQQKVDYIRAIESGRKQVDVAKEFGLTKTTLNTIWKDRVKILAAYSQSEFSNKCKRFRHAEHPDLEEALLRWFKQARALNIPITGPILQAKASIFATLLNYDDFECSTGWLHRFKERKGIVFKQLSGESASVSPDTVSVWQKQQIPDILKKYKPADIYNADETGLFFKLLPDKSLNLRGETCSGGKKSKERITVLLCTNMDGSDKIKPLVIGKSLNPRCFKGLVSKPVDYVSNKKSLDDYGHF